MLIQDGVLYNSNYFLPNEILVKLAEMIVDNFISYLSTTSNWNLFVVQPNFLKDNVQEYAKDGEIKYLYGDFVNYTSIQNG